MQGMTDALDVMSGKLRGAAQRTAMTEAHEFSGGAGSSFA
jgi:hypothetical protein